MSKQRIVELQKSLKVARAALERIQAGHRNPEGLAEQALDEMWKLEPKQQLQGIVGHAPKEFWTKGLRYR
jgi:hypothetical protein